MTIKFTIEDPILDESIIHQAHRYHRARAFGSLALAFSAFALGMTAVWFGATTDSITRLYAWTLSTLGVILLSLSVAAVFRAGVNADIAGNCKPLPVGWCEDALALARKHPELELYRKAVASARQFMHGDFYAMSQFAKNKPRLDACKSLHQIDEPCAS